MLQYRTKEGDRLDQICYKHYGDVNTLVTVLDANIGLEQQPPILPAGLLINLPEIEQKTEFDSYNERIYG